MIYLVVTPTKVLLFSKEETMIKFIERNKEIISTLSIVALVTVSLTTFAQKQTSSTTHIKFFSSTPAENIEANNYKSVSTLDTKTGDIVFSVPMQSFEFEKAKNIIKNEKN